VRLTDVNECKVFLQIDPADTSEDLRLGFFIEMASAWIEESLNRVGQINYQSRTQYYKGSGTPKLLLRARPVFTSPTIQAWKDSGAWYGSVTDSFSSSNALTYGTDFALEIDQDDGSSRSGILLRINDYWPKRGLRQTGYLSPFVGESFGIIKIIYTAGYTQDTLPAPLRLACNTLVAELKQLFPLGFLLAGENYEERGVTYQLPQKKPLLSMIEPMICGFRNYVM